MNNKLYLIIMINIPIKLLIVNAVIRIQRENVIKYRALINFDSHAQTHNPLWRG